MGRFDNIDLGSNQTMARQIRSAVRQRHDALRDVITKLKEANMADAARLVENMIDEEAREVGI